jgi:thiol-disulfide isomerase/thioredoxin/uncharacterized membrane protein YphA (DoxX/SURF4 family)
MSWTLLAIRVLLAVVFAAAGMAKLFDLKGSQKAVMDFGLPPWTARSLGISLPVAEIAMAFLLLPVRSAWLGAMGALVLLLVFIAAIAINIALGRKPECHCFGQVHSEPVGWPALVRNGVLALLAAALVWQAKTNPGLSVLSVIRGFTAVQLLAGTFCLLTLIALGSLCWLVLNLFRQNGRLLLRIEALEANRPVVQQQVPARPVPQGLSIGTRAIPFDLPRIEGGRGTLEGFLREEKPVLLISTDPNCGPCNTLMPEIARWQKELASELTIALISSGRLRDNEAKVAEYGLANVMFEADRAIANKYHAAGTPTAVLVGSDGKIASPALAGAERIRELINHRSWTAEGHLHFLNALAPLQQPPVRQRPSHPRGSVAPKFTLTDLRGHEVDSRSFNGNGTMLLFWNPSCGFCQKMLPELKKWEDGKLQNSPRLVLVSTGSVDANRAMGLESTVLIDEKFSVGQLFGANGTPSGQLLDSRGQIASELAVGQPGIMAILGGKSEN